MTEKTEKDLYTRNIPLARESMRLIFRNAALTIEIIERRKLSFNKAFREALNKVTKLTSEEKQQSYEIARKSILKSYLADYLLEKHGYSKIPLRRKCAFRVAFYLHYYKNIPLSNLERFIGGLLPKRIFSLLKKYDIIDIENEINKFNSERKLSIKYSFPEWIIRRISKFFNEKELESLIKSCEKYERWIRINTHKIDIDKGLRRLEEQNIHVVPDKDFPNLFKLVHAKKPLDEIKGFKEGYFISQDKASVATVYALEPHENEIILDATAAPGLKTELISELMNNKGKIIAIDIVPQRMYEMKKLMEKYGVKNVDFIIADSCKIKFSSIDKVLIDPSCTNTGSIAKDPAIRLILKKANKREIENYISLQREILSNLLKQNIKSYVVFSTCSILPEEGEVIIDNLLNSNKVELCPLRLGTKGYKGFKCSNYVMRYFMHLHHTIGFFIARIMRVS